jgi:uncharacterized protein involved in response to NO
MSVARGLPIVTSGPEEARSAASWAGSLRAHPYRLFFPIGIALAWAGVAHWFLHAIGVVENFLPIFHSMTQVQGFLIAFAVGFLFTMIPRRTESAPPAVWQLILGAIAPIATAIAAWFGAWALSQVFWIALCVTVLGFLFARFRSGKRRPPNSFVWIPIAFIVGIAGSILTGVGAALGDQYWWLHDLGRRVVLQGVFVSLILGIGGLAVPLMTRGDRPSDATSAPRDRRARLFHLLAAIAIMGSFGVEQFLSLRAAMFVRAAVVASVLILSADLLRRPRGPGLNRWLIWIAVWMIPIGYVAAGLFEQHSKAGLHIAFIGGFALLTLAVSVQVALGHGGFGELLKRRPLRSIAMVVALLGAIVPRVLMEVDPDRYFVWMGLAAALFLTATICWALLVMPALQVSSAHGP